MKGVSTMQTCDECKEKTYVIVLDREHKKECPKCRRESHPLKDNNNNTNLFSVYKYI